MTPEQVQQVRQALRNCQLPSRTAAARLRDAILHAKKSRAIDPAQIDILQTDGAGNAGRQQRTGYAYGRKYNPVR